MSNDEAREMLKPMSVEEVRDLLTSTLHGPLPHKTFMRIFATLSVWSREIEASAKFFEAIEGLHAALKHAKDGAVAMVQQVERGDYDSLRETAGACDEAMGELARITAEILKRKLDNGE